MKKKKELSNDFSKALSLIQDPKTESEGENILIDLSLNPYTRVYAIYELGKLYKKRDELKSAIACFEEIKKHKGLKYVPRVTFELGKIYLGQGNRQKAKEYYEEAIRIGSEEENYRPMFDLGKMYVSEGLTDQAIEILKQIIETPYRIGAIVEFARIFTNTGSHKIARNILINLLKKEKNEYAIQQLIFLDIKTNNIEEAYELLKELSEDYKYYDNIKAYLLYKMGRKNDICLDNFYKSQLVGYSENLTKIHIKRHLDEDENKRIHTLFNNNIDINTLFEEIKKKINNTKPVDYTIIEKYIICCDEEIATVDGEKTKYVEVITLPNTKNILTMYPIIVMDLEKEKQFRIEPKK